VLLFGHAGITLGIALSINSRLAKPNAPAQTAESSGGISSHSVLSRTFTRLDYRLVLLGSLLPDIIDKPIGIYLLGDTFNSGRILGHTLLFVLVLSTIGLFLGSKYNKWGILVVSLAAAIHLVLDQMWLTLHTLLWPIFGWKFPEIDLDHWWSGVIEGLVNRPFIYLSETAGLLVLVYFGIGLLRNKRVMNFLKHGGR
jgi:membrane-bound metal-dependent hydrolase YbcI (DUF457 family)